MCLPPTKSIHQKCFFFLVKSIFACLLPRVSYMDVPYSSLAFLALRIILFSYRLFLSRDLLLSFWATKLFQLSHKIDRL